MTNKRIGSVPHLELRRQENSEQVRGNMMIGRCCIPGYDPDQGVVCRRVTIR